MRYLAVYQKKHKPKVDYYDWTPENWPVKCVEFHSYEEAAIAHPDAIILTEGELDALKLGLRDEYEMQAALNVVTPEGEKPWWKFW